MGQNFSLATLSSGATGIDVPELSDLTYEKSLGTARFMKSIRARHQHGIVVVKLVMKPYPQVDLGRYVKAIRHERDALADVPNALGYHRILETSTNGYLVRQYLYSSLYDRMSTRPFLEDIEKKWLAFQLLCALRDCHARNVYHGDIKTENILVTSWNWLFLTDFSSSFKKTYLPEDNPADFSYYFDTSGRRTCYLAPERFLKAGEEGDNRGITWAMDVFSVGCVIAELFLEAPIFSLSQLYKYRKGEYSPNYGHLDKLDDKDVRELVSHMIQIEPESRYSADEYLNFWRRKTFPEYFYSFLHQYMGTITDPSSGHTPIVPETDNFGEADERIDKLYNDFDKVSYFLGYEEIKKRAVERGQPEALQAAVLPVQIDVPSNRHKATTMARRTVDDGSLIFLTLVVSSLRNTARSTSRVRACDLMLAFAERITDEAKLDRVLPYVVALLGDRANIVRISAIRTMTQLLALVNVVSPVNAYVFTEYIRPRLQPFVSGQGSKSKPLVRATYASCLADLALSASNLLDMIQALRADGSIPNVDPEAENGTGIENAYQALFDINRVDLVEHFELHTKALLTDNDAGVRRAFLGSVSSLCVFFGSSKASDVVLSHLNTYLNDKDWILKCAFFETIIGVATFVGGTSLEEYILPLMIQALTDPEEFVAEKVLTSFAVIADLGLFQRSRTWEMIDVAARFMIHPNVWIREAAAHFISSATRYLSIADTHCIVLPLIRPYLHTAIDEFTETAILDVLKKPLSRSVLEMAVMWATKVEKGIFWRPVQAQRTFSFGPPTEAVPIISSKDLRPDGLDKVPRNDEDEKWLTRLRNIGMGAADEFKLLALREYIWRMASKKPKESASLAMSKMNSVISLKELEVTPQTVFFELNQAPRKPQRRLVHKNDQADKSKVGSHTIADALLDASTTIDETYAQRKGIQVAPSKVHSNGYAGAQPVKVRSSQSRTRLSNISTSRTASPGAQQISRDPTTGGGHIDSRFSTLLSPSSAMDSGRSDGSLTPTGSVTTGRSPDVSNGLKHKQSAMHLLNRKDTLKTTAEISTTPTNAQGRVDTGLARGTSRGREPTVSRQENNSQFPAKRGTADHTYSGNDPHVIQFLDSLASENFPPDLADFGPSVKPVSSRYVIPSTELHKESRTWRPEGVLVATYGEHSGAINRILPSPDHAFFITASEDGTVKVWDTLKLEQSLPQRSRHTHRHAAGSKIKSIAFVELTHTFISCATDGSVHIVKVDYARSGDSSKYGRMSVIREYQLPKDEYAMWCEHLKINMLSMLMLATNKSRIMALDLRTMTVLYTLDNGAHHGTPTCFCVDRKRYWLLLGTSYGILDLWDLRFRIHLRAFGLADSSPIHRVLVHPLKDHESEVCIVGGTAQDDVMVWDIDQMQCHKVFRSATASRGGKDTLKYYEPMKIDDARPEELLRRFTATSESADNRNSAKGMCALAIGADLPEDGSEPKDAVLLSSGGSDKRIRLWDLSTSKNGTGDSLFVVSGLDVEESQPTTTISHPSTMLDIVTEVLPRPPPAPDPLPENKANVKTEAKRGTGKPPRSTIISLRQQHLLKTHLDQITDVALLAFPVGMTVSVDRSGIIHVFR